MRLITRNVSLEPFGDSGACVITAQLTEPRCLAIDQGRSHGHTLHPNHSVAPYRTLTSRIESLESALGSRQ